MANIACQLCAMPDPDHRSIHWFDLIERGLEFFRAHLETAYAGHDDLRHIVAHNTTWAATLVETYSGRVDPETGAPLSWRQARRQIMAMGEGYVSGYKRLHPWQPPPLPHKHQEETSC